MDNLDESDQFTLGSGFIRKFDVTIDPNVQELQSEKEVCKNCEFDNDTGAKVFSSRKLRLNANKATSVSLRMRIFIESKDKKQINVVPNPCSQSAAILGRILSVSKRILIGVSDPY